MVSIGAVGAGMPPPPAPPQEIRLPPAEIESNQRAETLIDWTASEIHQCPYLHNLLPAKSQVQLPTVLERVGQTVTLHIHNFPPVSADEEVSSEAIRHGFRLKEGINTYPAKQSKFRYIIKPLPGGEGWEEYRADPEGNPLDSAKLSDFYMLTSGFASVGLYLSATDQQDTRYRYFGTQTVRNQECHVVGFAQDPASVHSVVKVFDHGKSVALLIQGLAWIDPATFQVLRVTTWLLAPRSDIGLHAQVSTVDFYPVQPSGWEKMLWLPRDVTVETEYRGFELRNTHHYSNFQLFRTESAGAVSARLQEASTLPQTPKTGLQLTPADIALYKRAQTLIDWTPSQIQHSPYLHNLRPAKNQDQLAMVLERVGQTGTLLLQNFPQVSCDEEVFSEASRGGLHPGEAMQDGEIQHFPTKQGKFRYIVIPSPGGEAFEEYRTDPKGNPLDNKSLGDFYLITSDFASTWLYLSPADQHDSRFRYFGTQTIRDRECHVVGFAQNPLRVHRVVTFQLEGRTVILLDQGLAWIDSATFEVLRVKTWLLAPRADISLSSQVSTVEFHAVQPRGGEKTLWLPRDVTVEIEFRGTEIRNSHHYSNFKLFRVESTIKTGG
jgi:hypothetical protein